MISPPRAWMGLFLIRAATYLGGSAPTRMGFRLFSLASRAASGHIRSVFDPRTRVRISGTGRPTLLIGPLLVYLPAIFDPSNRSTWDTGEGNDRAQRARS
jgi:hypothetical protein